MRPQDRPVRPTHTAKVTESTSISPALIRLKFDCPALVGMDLPFTDHYIKLIFGDVTRTYTLRSFDTEAGTFEVDFVCHGDTGLAGPWAEKVQPGATISFKGPGGKWVPMEEFEHFMLVGDEAAAPAICAAIEKLPAAVTATVFLEISDPAAKFEVPAHPGCEIVWVPRDGAAHGTALASTVRAAGIPEKKTGWFVHGVAEMIRDLRRFLFVENKINKKEVSISGYWRTGMTEDQWQASKREFNQQLEQEESAQS